MDLDHVTIVTPDLEATRRFFVEVAGLEDGPRPPFGFDGYWLYGAGRALLHLVDGSGPSASGARVAPRIDHFALRVAPGAEWAALIGRLDAHGLPYRRADVPASAQRQLFVALAPDLVIEFVTDFGATAA